MHLVIFCNKTVNVSPKINETGRCLFKVFLYTYKFNTYLVLINVPIHLSYEPCSHFSATVSRFKVMLDLFCSHLYDLYNHEATQAFY